MRILQVLGLLAVAALVGGCTGGDSDDAGTNSNGGEAKKYKNESFVLGDLIDPFEPPTLKELDEKVEWQDMPVLDGLALLRERQQGEPVLATVQEALQLKNDSEEANEEITSALGRLPASDAEVDYDATFTRHTRADVKSTNPLMASSTIEFDIGGLTSFGLFSFDWNFRPFAVTDTVVSWQSSKDRMYDKVVMRDDLTWSDGEPITAHDVVFSYQVIMSEHVPIPAQRSGTDQIKWIEAYDDHTLVFFHKEALATNIWNLNFSVVPKHAFESTIADDPTLQNNEAHVAFENQPVTGGAYEFASRERNQQIVLRRRESYYMHDGKQVRDKPFFKEVVFKIIADPTVSLLALKRGDIDELQLTTDQWRNQSSDDEFYQSNTKARGLEWTYFYFGWNCKTPFFSDARVRNAMSYAFDYDEMLNTLMFGLVEQGRGIFHSTSPYAPEVPSPYFKQNLDKAEELLNEAGWEDTDGDGILDKEIDGKQVPFEFSILVMNNPERIKVCELLKDNLEQIGIICNVRPMEFTVLQQRNRDHEFEATMAGWGTGADPDTSINIWGTDAGRNYVQYSNSEVDDLFEAGRLEFDPEKRAAIYAKIHEILYADQPYTWLFFRNSFYGFNKSLRGYNFSPRGPYHYSPGIGSIWKPAAL